MMQKAAFYKTVAELAAAGPERVPAELISTEHVIYNSPASLSFNSPGSGRIRSKKSGTGNSRIDYASRGTWMLRSEYDDFK